MVGWRRTYTHIQAVQGRHMHNIAMMVYATHGTTIRRFCCRWISPGGKVEDSSGDAGCIRTLETNTALMSPNTTLIASICSSTVGRGIENRGSISETAADFWAATLYRMMLPKLDVCHLASKLN